MYEPSDGQILINDKDIRTLKLDDLRLSISVLFQDYTHFPLSVGLTRSFLFDLIEEVQIRDNIGLGDPDSAEDDQKVQEAARLGGADEFIKRLPDGFNTYLERPVKDYYSGLPEGTTSLFGRPVNYGQIRNVAGMESSTVRSLSGGQMQRIAL